jgi:hypothetical protein
VWLGRIGNSLDGNSRCLVGPNAISSAQPFFAFVFRVEAHERLSLPAGRRNIHTNYREQALALIDQGYESGHACLQPLWKIIHVRLGWIGCNGWRHKPLSPLLGIEYVLPSIGTLRIHRSSISGECTPWSLISSMRGRLPVFWSGSVQ